MPPVLGTCPDFLPPTEKASGTDVAGAVRQMVCDDSHVTCLPGPGLLCHVTLQVRSAEVRSELGQAVTRLEQQNVPEGGPQHTSLA